MALTDASGYSSGFILTALLARGLYLLFWSIYYIYYNLAGMLSGGVWLAPVFIGLIIALAYQGRETRVMKTFAISLYLSSAISLLIFSTFAGMGLLLSILLATVGAFVAVGLNIGLSFIVVEILREMHKSHSPQKPIPSTIPLYLAIPATLPIPPKISVCKYFLPEGGCAFLGYKFEPSYHRLICEYAEYNSKCYVRIQIENRSTTAK